MLSVGHWFGAFLGLFLASQVTWADNFYSKVKSCPKGTRAHTELLSEVSPNLLPQYQPDQGDTPTCAIHASMILANSIYRLKQTQIEYPPGESSLNQDLSILDGMFKFGRIEEEEGEDCSLPYMANISSFLLKLRQHPRVLIDPSPLTINTALAGNNDLIKQMERCQAAKCGQRCSRGENSHPPCLMKTCRKAILKNLAQDVTDWDQISKDLDPNFPIQTLLQNSHRTEVQVPPFQLKTWDLLESKNQITHDLVEAFTHQSTTLPFALETLFDSDDECGHAVVLTRIEKVNCKDPDGIIRESRYNATLLNSWGRGRNGPYDLDELARGMLKWGRGFTQILPCDPLTQNCTVPLVEHPRSTPLVHYAQANDLNQVRSLLSRKDTQPNQSDSSGITPLIEAAMEGYSPVLRALLERPDTDPNLPNGSNATALYFAAQDGHLECVKALMERSDLNPNLSFEAKTPLYAAAMFGHTEIVRQLLSSPKVSRLPHPELFEAMRNDPNTRENYLRAKKLIEDLAKEFEGQGPIETPTKKRKRPGSF